MADEIDEQELVEEEVEMKGPPKQKEEEAPFIEDEENQYGDEEIDENQSSDEEPLSENILTIREGDIFVYEGGTIALCVLAIQSAVSENKQYRVRLYANVVDFIEVSSEDLFAFIANNELKKLDTYRDQIEKIAEKLVLSQGDVFTKDGVFFAEIMSDSFLYVDLHGKEYTIVGIKSSNGFTAFRDQLEVVDAIYGNTDQFPISH